MLALVTSKLMPYVNLLVCCRDESGSFAVINNKNLYQFYQTCKAHDTYKTANIFLLL